MCFEIGPCLADFWFGILFSTASEKILSLVIMLLSIMMSCSGVLGVTYALADSDYWLITLKKFAIGSEET